MPQEARRRAAVADAVVEGQGQGDDLAHLDSATADAGVDTAVEEILRWTTPALHSGRTATADTEIAGRPIRAGDIVTVWNASANHDEQVFGDPGRLRLDRTPDKHCTFAHGPHFCLGAYLARAEIGAVLEGLRDRVQTLEQTGPARPVYSNFLSGLCELPLALK